MRVGGASRRAVARALTADRRGLAEVLLRPAAGLYGFVAGCRAAAYERGIFVTRRLSTPVISVGNLTLGGTGKTPIVAAIAKHLEENGHRVVILSRGYGRRSRSREVIAPVDGELEADAFERGGDEPALLARELRNGAVVVDADRFAAGLWAETHLRPTVFVLDDGFQHYRLARDLDILVVDATDPFGGGRTPPLGRLREPASAMARTDLAIVTRSSRVTRLESIVDLVRRGVRDDVKVLAIDHSIVAMRRLGGDIESLAGLRGQRVAAIAAVGNPKVFLQDLSDASLHVVSTAIFPDHHDYSEDDVELATRDGTTAGARVLVTTEKDAVKLERFGATAIPIYAARIEFGRRELQSVFDLCDATIRTRIPGK